MQIGAEHLTKVFTDWLGRPRRTALADLTMRFADPGIYGLLGPDGSGKSTTLHLCLGLLRPTAGTVSILGGDPGDARLRARIGFLPEHLDLPDFLTAEEAVTLGGRLYGMPRSELRKKAPELLEWVGLKDQRGLPVGELARGARRRLGLARALVHDPDLLLLDEPVAGLDPLGHRELKERLRDLRNRGTSILLASHMLADIEDICDQVHILFHGKTVTKGRLRELTRVHGIHEFRTKGLSTDAVDAVRSLILEQGGRLDVDEAGRETIETFFIRLFRNPRRSSRQVTRRSELRAFLAAVEDEESRGESSEVSGEVSSEASGEGAGS